VAQEVCAFCLGGKAAHQYTFTLPPLTNLICNTCAQCGGSQLLTFAFNCFYQGTVARATRLRFAAGARAR
jgi:hypothetical protein